MIGPLSLHTNYAGRAFWETRPGKNRKNVTW